MKTSIKHLEDNVAFYETGAENVKRELTKVTAEGILLGESFDSSRAPLVYLHKKLAAKDAVIKSVV